MDLRRTFKALITNLYFLFTPHNGEKSLTGMRIAPLAVHSGMALPLVDQVSYSGRVGAPGLLLELERNTQHPCYVPFYDGPTRCAVTSVSHMRSNKKQHELILVEFAVRTRGARIERPGTDEDELVLPLLRAHVCYRRDRAVCEAVVEWDVLRVLRVPLELQQQAWDAAAAAVRHLVDERRRQARVHGQGRDPHAGQGFLVVVRREAAVQTLSALPAGTLDILEMLA